MTSADGPLVTGLGMVTRAGLGTAAAWAAAAAGANPAPVADPTLTRLPWPYTHRVPHGLVEQALGTAEAWRHDRFTQLALVAATEALADAGLDPAHWTGDRVGVVCGTAFGGVTTITEQQHELDASGSRFVSPYLLPKSMPNMVAGILALTFGARGPCLATASASASGLTAIGVAAAFLRSGACDLVLTGGADSALTPLCIAGLGQINVLAPDGICRPFSPDRAGFVPAEGAAILVLERPDHARARGARPLARVAGFGSTADAHHPLMPDPAGAGLAAAIRATLHDAEAVPEQIDLVHAHGTGTPAGDAAEARAIAAVLGPGVPVTTAKPYIGHTFGASGAISAALAILGMTRSETFTLPDPFTPDPALPVIPLSGGLRPRHVRSALCQAIGFGGHNTALLLTGI